MRAIGQPKLLDRPVGRYLGSSGIPVRAQAKPADSPGERNLTCSWSNLVSSKEGCISGAERPNDRDTSSREARSEKCRGWIGLECEERRRPVHCPMPIALDASSVELRSRLAGMRRKRLFGSATLLRAPPGQMKTCNTERALPDHSLPLTFAEPT